MSDEEKEIQECDALSQKLEQVSEARRRETILSWTSKYKVSLDPPKASSSGDLAAADVIAEKIKNLSVDTSNRNIKQFSGAKTFSGGEVNFRRWNRAAKRVIEDEELTEAQKKRIILRSLVGKADDSIEMIRGRLAGEIVDFLKSLYGNVSSVEDLKANFIQHFQNENETASDYLTELYIDLCEIMELSPTRMNLFELHMELMAQFCRGTHDEELLTKLGWEADIAQEKGDWTFPKMFEKLRTEEARRTERRLRQRTRKANNMQTSVDHEKQVGKIKLLEERLCNLEKQQSEEVEQKVSSSKLNPDAQDFEPSVSIAQRLTRLEQQVDRQVVSKGFCYRCGEEGHFASMCNNPPNTVLVRQKSEVRRERLRYKTQGNE